MSLCACTQVTPPAEHIDEGPSKKDEPAPSLTRITQEPPGANCAEGGSKLEEGFDTDLSSTLDPDEVLRTEYACNGLVTLFATERFSSHADCEGSGVLLRSGVDDDGDGALQPGEIDDESALCDGSDRGNCGPERTIEGNLRLESSIDINLVVDCETITGNLVVAFDVTDLELPALRTLGGDLELLDEVGEVQVPALESIGGSLIVNRDRSRIHLPALQTLGGGVSMPWASLLDTPSLTTLGGSLQTGEWSTVLVPELTRLGRHLIPGQGTLVRAPKLESVSGGILARTSSRLELASVSAVSGNFTIEGEVNVTMPRLQSVTGWLRLGASQVSLPALTQTGDITVQHSSSASSSLEAPNLTSASALILVPGVGGASVDLPALTSLGRLHLAGTAATLTLPALTEVGSLELVPKADTLTALPASISRVTGDLSIDTTGAVNFGRLELPALARIDGNLTAVEPNATELAFPALTTIAGTLAITDADPRLQDLELPELLSLGTMELRDARNLSVTAPKLSSVDGAVTLEDAPRALQAGALASVGDALNVVSSKLMALALPALSSVGAALTVRHNDALSRIDFASLDTVHGDALFFSNRVLSTCDVAALEVQIRQGTLGGSFTNSANQYDLCEAVAAPCSGDRSINIGDIVSIQRCSEITGSLTIQAPNSGADVYLPLLRRIDGNVDINGAIGALEMPALQSVGGFFRLNASLATASELPALASIGHAFSSSAAGTLRLPALTEIDFAFGGDLLVGPGFSLTADVLTAVSGPVRVNSGGVLVAPTLQSTGGSLRILNGARAELNGLRNVGRDILIESDSTLLASSLLGANEGIDIGEGAAVHLAGLQNINGDLNVDRGATTTFTSLESVTGDIYIFRSSASLPALNRAGSFYLRGPDAPFESVQLTLGADRFDGLLRLRGNIQCRMPDMTYIDRLSALQGAIRFWAPNLDGVAQFGYGGSVQSTGYFDLRALREVGTFGSYGVNHNLGLALPSLERVTGVFDLRWANVTPPEDWRNALYLPQLTSVGSDMRIRNTMIRHIELPRLTSTGSLTISGNELLQTLSAPLLSSVGDVAISGNTRLGPCEVEALDDRLDAVGHTGSRSYSNNQGGSCTAPCQVDGDYTIAIAGDAAAISSCDEITGNLTIASGLGISLPALERVGGNLTVPQTSNAKPFARLARIGGNLDISTTVGALSLPSLVHVSGTAQLSGDASIDVHSLSTVGEDLTVAGRVASNTLLEVGGELIVGPSGVLIAPALAHVAQAVRIRDHADATLSGLSSLGTDLQLDRGSTLTANLLMRVPGNLGVSTSALLSAALLASVGGDVIIQGGVTLDTPLLASIDGVLEVGASTVSLPALSQISPEGIRISHFSSASAVLTLGALATLTRVQLRSHGSLVAPVATTAGSIEIYGGTTSANLPALTQADRIYVSGEGERSFEATLGALTHLDSLSLFEGAATNLHSQLGTLKRIDGDLYIDAVQPLIGNDSSVWNLSALTHIERDMWITELDWLTGIQSDALSYVRGDVTITNNPLLSQCDVDALVQQLTAGGSLGPFTSGGNATCP